jgi:RND family efflux transporter MFP subunit
MTFFKSKWFLGILAVLILGGGYLYVSSNKPPTYVFIPVTQGSITETVSVTGNTTPMNTVSLGFQDSGTIANVNYTLGEQVNAGDVIAQLNTASLNAALQQAQAAYASALASQSATSLPQAQTQAVTVYLSGYTTLESLFENDISLFFGSPSPYGPELLINAPMYPYGSFSMEYDTLTNELLTYQSSLASASSTAPETLLANASSVVQDVSNFLNELTTAANGDNSGASDAQKAALATASNGVSTLLGTLSSARSTYLTQSVGATSLADASVEQAAAGVAAAQANLQGTEIVAPISGTLTQQDAKVGQFASPGTTLVSIIGTSGFEVDAGVSETDVGKLAIGDDASMTLDAFPNETFTGKVFYIAPAETNTNGVITYLTKISFDQANPELKSGLTANVDIQTKVDNNALILPQYAILQNGDSTFVETLVGNTNTTTTTPVTLGIEDENGNVEVLSGVTLGEKVINIGLKQ